MSSSNGLDHPDSRPLGRVKTNRNRTNKVEKSELVTKQQVRSMLQSQKLGRDELKWFDAQIALSATSTGSVTNLTAIPQSVGPSARTGIEIDYDKLMLNVIVSYGDPSFNVVRIIIFKWIPHTNYVLPTVNDILGPGLVGTTRDYLSHYNESTKQNFQILSDNLNYLCTSSSVAVKSGTPHFINLRGRARFSDAATFGTNSVHMLVISDSNAAPHPGLVGVTRVFYTDA